MIDDLKINEQLKRRYYEQGLWTSATLEDAWNGAVERFRQRPYVRDDHGCAFTYGQVDQLASRLAWWLRSQGVESGDVVTFQMPKWAEFAIIYVACVKAGAVMHPIDIRSCGDDICYYIGKTHSKVYICPTTYRGRNLERAFAELLGELPSVNAALYVDRECGVEDSAHVALSHVLETCPPLAEPSPAQSDDVVSILSTSGTTGPAKLAMMTHNTLLFSERSYVSVLGLSPDDVMWMPSPLNHATGFYHGLVSVMLLGGSTVLQQEFDALQAIQLINHEGCTWSHGATPFIHDLVHALEETGGELPSMRLYLCGGAPVPSTMIQRAHRHGILLCESYGSTESCPHVYVPPAKCLEWDGAWSGVPYDGIEVRVVDEQRRPLAAGEQGEEASRGPHMFVGYLNDRARTDKDLDDEGWFYSGDLCYADEQGRIRINGRKKEIIIRGGENLSVVEIDEHLAGCPGVGPHATIGMPDERMGERICTFVVPAGKQPTLDEVKDYLAHAKVPKRYWPERLEYIDRIPYTATGKVQRYKLATELLRRMTAESQANQEESI